MSGLIPILVLLIDFCCNKSYNMILSPYSLSIAISNGQLMLEFQLIHHIWNSELVKKTESKIWIYLVHSTIPCDAPSNIPQLYIFQEGPVEFQI